MKIDAGILLKNLREEIFKESIRIFSEKINIHYTTYHNYESNKFGKNPLKIFHEISRGLSNLIIKDSVLKFELKKFILNLFLKSFSTGSQDFNYLFTADVSSDKATIEYLKYVFVLAHTHCNLKEMVFENSFHEEQRNCTNKIIEISKPKNINVIGHIEDYTIHLKSAYDHPSIDFNCMLEGNDISINDVIDEKCVDMNIKNFSLGKSINQTSSKLKELVVVYFYLHHIQKKVDKFQFLKMLYDKMKENSLLCIVEPVFENNDEDYEKFKTRWKMVKDDTNSEFFWNSLNSLEIQEIEKVTLAAKQAEENMDSIGENYLNKINEFLVTPEFIEKNAKKIGFQLLLNQRIGYFPDRLFLFKK